MELQKKIARNIIDKTSKRTKIIILFIIFLIFVVLTVFAKADNNMEQTAPLTINYIFLQIMELLIGVGGLSLTIIKVIKIIFNDKIKPDCEKIFAKIEGQFTKTNDIKPICGERYVELKENLIDYKNQMQTYLCNVGALQTSFGKLEAKFETFEKRFDRLEKKIDEIK